MTVLSSAQRKLLSDVVVRARDLVEAACAQRIIALGVAANKAPAVLTEEERAVRVGLRARARQLGSGDALVTEAGFEHWHRMLFARFLADNQLLVDDQFGQPLTMDEVAEYAAETGETDKWEVAARFAAAMLPGIFTQGDPILAMRLPVETRQELERLLDRLPVEVITAEDSLGWVYQYWQTKRKEEVKKSERKIGGADLAPVTQLFTEDYMVRFLLENSLGAWWAARHPDSPLLAGWEYLRRNDDGTPAVGGFDGWPEHVAEVTVMDPCCGSGHFLTAAFGMLWRMRVEEERLAPIAAQNAVLRDNLFGLELDPRCAQIAMFALAVEAWKSGGYRQFPLPNVACCGIPARAPLQDWLGLGADDPLVEGALTRLHTLFANADTLGSLIDPVRATEQAGLESIDWHLISPLVHKALSAEAMHQVNDPAAAVFGQAAAGIARAADYLTRHYSLVLTNPPYLSAVNQGQILKTHLVAHFDEAKGDLATAMIARFLDHENGAQAVVVPQNWLFLSGYKRFRARLLQSHTIAALAQLGAGAFSGISGEVVKPVLVVLVHAAPAGGSHFLGLSAQDAKGAGQKAEILRNASATTIDQVDCLQNVDSVITLESSSPGLLLGKVARSTQGICTGDIPRFGRKFWEIPRIDSGWVRQQSTVTATSEWAGREHILWWQEGSGDLFESVQDRLGPGNEGAWIRGLDFVGRQGVAISQSGDLKATLYAGDLLDNNCAAIVPDSPDDLPALWAYCSSDEYSREVRVIDRALKVTNQTLLKVPFDAARWRSVASARYPDGLPEPSSADPTQWLFTGLVVGSRNPLQTAVARLLGFCWPEQQLDALEGLTDSDGVVCLPSLGGESPAGERVRNLLAVAFGGSWTSHALDRLLGEVGAKPGAAGLDSWLRNGFFKDHCKVFANRPFIWQVWDGRPDGFSALLNYHKLDRKLLERLTYDYLGSWWIGRLNDEIRQRMLGAEARLVAAEELKKKLQLILEGEPPYDIYVRWKSLAEQPMGWEPDLDDGVRLNIRPFMTAGVLRVKPNIKWEKDRGKNPDGTERLNDLHFTLAEKRAAQRGEVR